jgi:uncharacterized protein (TIGR03083 family)
VTHDQAAAAPDRAAQRDELVAAYEAALDGVLDATDGLDAARWDAATGCPGWSVHDQLAHCVGLERRILGDPDRDPDVVVPDLPHLTGEVGRTVERDVESRRAMAHADLRAEAEATFDRRRSQLADLAPEQLGEPSASLFGEMPLFRALRMRTFDLVCHQRDVRAAVGRLDGLTGAAVTMAVEHVLRTWGRIVPARVDDGRTLTLRVDGHGSATVDLASGEVHRDEAATTTAAATVRLTPDAALALAGGRDDAPGVDELTIEGDEALVRRFLAVAAVTP